MLEPGPNPVLSGTPWWAAQEDAAWWTDRALTTVSGEVTGDDVVLVDDDGRGVGTAARATVHGASTPLHLAFSCYAAGPDGRLLVTRRALTKRTWPGVWTNAFCGHPRPGESYADAIARHADGELGLTVRDVRPALPAFRYRAVDASGTVENEICPVFTAVLEGEPTPSPDEVAEHAWVTPDELRTLVEVAPWAVSPWMVQQVRALGPVLG